MGRRPIDAILGKMLGMNKWRRDFFHHNLHLFLSMRGRHNFENMERYGTCDECSYRQNFEKPFDLALFNREPIQQTGGPEPIAAFDPSYIAKSGKHRDAKGHTVRSQSRRGPDGYSSQPVLDSPQHGKGHALVQLGRTTVGLVFN